MAGAAMLCAPVHAQNGRVAVEGAPAALQDDLRSLLREESAPQSLFDARRQSDRAAAAVQRLMESEGYFAAEVTPWAEGVDTFQRGVRVEHGPLFTYGETRIDFTGNTPDAEVIADLERLLEPLAAGAPARAQPVINAGDAMVQRLRRAGYPDAASQPVDALADGRAHTLDLAFQLAPGVRASFGELVITGADRTRPSFIEGLKPWDPGDRVTPARLDEFRSRLAETGLFDSATARLEDSRGQNAGGDAIRDIAVDLRERKRRTIAIGASTSTSEGEGVEAEWQQRNLTGRGDSVTVGAQAATLERRLEAAYRRPSISRYGRNFRIGARIEDFSTDAFGQTGGSVFAAIEERLTRRLRGSLGVEAGYASIDDQIARSAGSGRRDLYILTLLATAEYIGVEDVLDPQGGVRARLAVEPGVTTGDTTINFTRMVAEASLYQRLGTDRLIGALRTRIGAIAGPNGAPPDKLFFAGGGGSVRGYEYQSLSPRDAAGELVGGRSLVETSAELRFRATRNLGFVAFVDAGAAGRDFEPDFSEARTGAGIGVRYYAGFGPLRADIAAPLDRRSGEADFQVYISIGQAF